MEKEIAMHSSTLAWKIPWTEKPGRLQSMGSKKKKKRAEFNEPGHCTKTHPSGRSLFLPWSKGRRWTQRVKKPGLLL